MAEPIKEKVVEYGEKDGVPFVITEADAGNNVVRNKYVGDQITDRHKREIEQLESEKKDKEDFERFKSERTSESEEMPEFSIGKPIEETRIDSEQAMLEKLEAKRRNNEPLTDEELLFLRSKGLHPSAKGGFDVDTGIPKKSEVE